MNEWAGIGNHNTAQFWEMDTRTGRRLERDPVDYPWQSDYATFDISPIWKSDYLRLFGTREEAREYKKENNLKGRIRIDDEGYYSIDDKKEHTSIYKDMETGEIVTSVLVTGKRSDSKLLTPFQLGKEWLTGRGTKSRDFTSGDYTVELYKQHDHYKNAFNDVTNKLKAMKAGDSLPDYSFPYELSGVEGVGKYVKDYSTLATGGLTGNLMFTYLGSHGLWIEVTAVDVERRIATVTFTVHNRSTFESATRLPYFGYKKWYQNTVGKFINEKVVGRTGPTSETEQVFQWDVQIQY